METYSYQSQIGQDRFVVQQLNEKRGGTFLDVGACFYKTISNTYYLEKALGWRGVAMDIDPKFEEEWVLNRPNTQFLTCDATKVDYKQLSEDYNLGSVIDYLSLDLEPPEVTLAALQEILKSGLMFRVITFETDFYRYKDSREPSRKLLDEYGYNLTIEGEQDDFYVLRSQHLTC